MGEVCQRCQGRSLNAFLCGDCETELKDLLGGLVGRECEGRAMAGWLSLLEDAARGQTRLGVSVRRSTELAGPLPFNERASDLLCEAHELLSRWVGAINHNNETLGQP